MPFLLSTFALAAGPTVGVTEPPTPESADSSMPIHSPDRLQLRLHSSLDGTTDAANRSIAIAFNAQVPVSNFISLWTELGVNQDRAAATYTDHSPIPGVPEQMHDVTLVANGLTATLGAGPRWTSAGGAEIHLIIGARANPQRAGRVTRDQATDIGIASQDSAGFYGPTVGVVGVTPFAPRSSFAFRWELWGQVMAGSEPSAVHVRGNILDNFDSEGFLPMPYAGTHAMVFARPALSFQPQGTGLGASIGVIVATNRIGTPGGNPTFGDPGVHANLLYTR